MAGADRTSSRALNFVQALLATPYKFGFFQAVRRLECAHRDKPRLGQSLRPSDDPVRLGQDPSLVFAPSTLASYTPGKAGRPARLGTYFFGLLGPQGPLPLHLTEYARDRERNASDSTFARFLDLFHHRMLSLYYRAWANTQATVSFERPESDRFAVYLGALFGIGMPSLRDRDPMPDKAKLHYAGRLACQSRHPEGLRSMVQDFFGGPASIEEFIGEWMDLPAGDRWRLGESRDTGSLGGTVILGSRVWGCQHKFRLTIGPLGYDEYERMLPGGESLRQLVSLVRNYIGDQLAWDVVLVLKRDEVPKLNAGQDCRLGWTTWLGERDAASDADDLTLDPLTRVA